MVKGGVRELAAAAVVAWLTTLLLTLALVGYSPAKQKQMDTLVKVTPSKTTLYPGEAFTVAVSVEPGSGDNVAGVQFGLSYDKQAVKVTSIEEGGFLKQGGAPTWFMPGTINNDEGTLYPVVQVVTAPGQSVSTPGTVATIHCEALKAGLTSNFGLYNVVVGNKDAVALPLGSPVIVNISVVSPLDLNQDGLVDEGDLVMAAAAFGETGTRPEDVNKDGKVDVLDLIVIGQNIAV
jgi:hypothetical protein